MGEKWRANVAYGPAGTRVEYEGTIYELIQPHTSQIGWEPSIVPALWRVARNQDSGSGHHSSGHHSSGHHHHHSSSSSDDDKHHHHHSDHHHSSKPEQTQQPAQTQPQQQQQQPAQSQPQPNQFQQQQNMVAVDQTPYKWVDYKGGAMPQNCISQSNRLGKTFVVARANIDGGCHVGYVDPAKGNHGRIYFGYGGKEIVMEEFQILTVEPNRYIWVTCTDPKNINGKPIEGGYEKDKTPIYVTKCMQGDVTYFGKTSAKATCAYYGYNTKEVKTQQFQVLCVN